MKNEEKDGFLHEEWLIVEEKINLIEDLRYTFTLVIRLEKKKNSFWVKSFYWFCLGLEAVALQFVRWAQTEKLI